MLKKSVGIVSAALFLATLTGCGDGEMEKVFDGEGEDSSMMESLAAGALGGVVGGMVGSSLSKSKKGKVIVVDRGIKGNKATVQRKVSTSSPVRRISKPKGRTFKRTTKRRRR